AGSLAGCDWPEGTRYVDVVFEGYEATTGIPYRTTMTHTGEPITLRLDVYEPAGDTAEERPVIMWMFGGAWRAGDRNQLASYAQDSARRGYVGVTIDYRIRPEGGDLIAASNDAYEDTLAAIRWLQDHAEQFRIDPDAIVPAGYSAGAINALHALHRPADTPAAAARRSCSVARPTRWSPTRWRGTSASRRPTPAARAASSPTRAATTSSPSPRPPTSASGPPTSSSRRSSGRPATRSRSSRPAEVRARARGLRLGRAQVPTGCQTVLISRKAVMRSRPGSAAQSGSSSGGRTTRFRFSAAAASSSVASSGSPTPVRSMAFTSMCEASQGAI